MRRSPQPTGFLGCSAKPDVDEVRLAVVELDTDPPVEVRLALGGVPVVVVLLAVPAERAAGRRWVGVQRLVHPPIGASGSRPRSCSGGRQECRDYRWPTPRMAAGRADSRPLDLDDESMPKPKERA
jgi:hypothetical protein